jgi:large subunit ribosomal protein L6
MSRIGKNPITVPSGVELSIQGNVVTVKGPKGELTQEVNEVISMEYADNVLTFSRPNDDKEVRSKHGLYRALIQNMITGVSEGYKVQLQMVGVGFRAAAQGQQLSLSLGYSHPIIFELPKEVKLEAETKKGEAPLVTLSSHDKQLLGTVAAKIRTLRKIEPYKGKGFASWASKSVARLVKQLPNNLKSWIRRRKRKRASASRAAFAAVFRAQPSVRASPCSGATSRYTSKSLTTWLAKRLRQPRHLARMAPKVPSLTKPLRWESQLQKRPKLQECPRWFSTAMGTSTMAAFKNLLKLPAKVA